MNLSNLIRGLLSFEKEIDVKKLPSLGLFYKDDFKIRIKKAKIEDIVNYEHNFTKDIVVIINKIKNVVCKNTILSEKYTFDDIKSIDIVYLFLEIVKFTNGKPISLSYFSEIENREINIEFSSKYFNYFKINSDLVKKYNNEEKCFTIKNYKYSLPSIGVENSLTDYLIVKSNEENAEKYNNYFYSFTYFLGNKSKLTFDEIDNLIQIFNFDIETVELEKIKEIIKIFEPIQKYSLKNGKDEVDLNSKIDLSKVWK
jgi:hypothetical protein